MADTTGRENRIYAAIDLKSFYASVEVVDRNLDPMTTNLVVADRSRTSKTICLAVSPSLKAYGIPGRARLFEVEQRVSEVNGEKEIRIPEENLREVPARRMNWQQDRISPWILSPRRRGWRTT